MVFILIVISFFDTLKNHINWKSWEVEEAERKKVIFFCHEDQDEKCAKSNN